MLNLPKESPERENKIAEIKNEMLTFPPVKALVENFADFAEAESFFMRLCNITDANAELNTDRTNERLFKRFLGVKTAVENLGKLDDDTLSADEKNKAAEDMIKGINIAMKTGTDSGNVFNSFTRDLEDVIIDSNNYDEYRVNKSVSFMFAFGEAGTNLMSFQSIENAGANLKKTEPLIKQLRRDCENFENDGEELLTAFAEEKIKPSEIDAEISKTKEFIKKTKDEIENRESEDFKKKTEKQNADTQSEINENTAKIKTVNDKISSLQDTERELFSKGYSADKFIEYFNEVDEKEKSTNSAKQANDREIEELISVKNGVNEYEKKVKELQEKLDTIERTPLEANTLLSYNIRKKWLNTTNEHIEKLGREAETSEKLQKRSLEIHQKKNEFIFKKGYSFYEEGASVEIDNMSKEYRREVFRASNVVRDALKHYYGLEKKVQGDLEYNEGKRAVDIEWMFKELQHEKAIEAAPDMKKILERTAEKQKEEMGTIADKQKDFFSKYIPVEKELEDAQRKLAELKAKLPSDVDEKINSRKAESERLSEVLNKNEKRRKELLTSSRELLGLKDDEMPTDDKFKVFSKECNEKRMKVIHERQEFQKNNSVEAFEAKIAEGKKSLAANSSANIEKRNTELKEYLNVARRKLDRLETMQERLENLGNKFIELADTENKLKSFSKKCFTAAADDNVEELLSMAANTRKLGMKKGHKNSPEYDAMDDALINVVQAFSESSKKTYPEKIEALRDLRKFSLEYIAAKKKEIRPIPSNMRKIRLERAAILASLADRTIKSHENNIQNNREYNAIKALANGEAKFDKNADINDFTQACDKAVAEKIELNSRKKAKLEEAERLHLSDKDIASINEKYGKKADMSGIIKKNTVFDKAPENNAPVVNAPVVDAPVINAL